MLELFFNTFFPQMACCAKLAMRLKIGVLQQCKPLFTLIKLVNNHFIKC